MPDKKTRYQIVLSVLIFFLLLARSAQAYIDPGTGSYLFQLLIAGLLSGLFFIKTIFRSLKKIIKKND